MKLNSKTILLLIVAALVLIWGMNMEDGSGHSDETTYYSPEELAERQRVIDEMAKMRGETPRPSATPEPEKGDELDERFSSITMEELPQSFTLSRAGYDAEQQIVLVEFNLTELIYAYYDVPQEEWDRLLAAEDFDKWFDVMIMKRYKFEQLN